MKLDFGKRIKKVVAMKAGSSSSLSYSRSSDNIGLNDDVGMRKKRKRHFSGGNISSSTSIQDATNLSSSTTDHSRISTSPPPVLSPSKRLLKIRLLSPSSNGRGGKKRTSPNTNVTGGSSTSTKLRLKFSNSFNSQCTMSAMSLEANAKKKMKKGNTKNGRLFRNRKTSRSRVVGGYSSIVKSPSRSNMTLPRQNSMVMLPPPIPPPSSLQAPPPIPYEIQYNNDDLLHKSKHLTIEMSGEEVRDAVNSRLKILDESSGDNLKLIKIENKKVDKLKTEQKQQASPPPIKTPIFTSLTSLSNNHTSKSDFNPKFQKSQVHLDSSPHQSQSSPIYFSSKCPDLLLPPTPSLFIENSSQAHSSALFEFCLQKPIVLIRNLSSVCSIDLSLYTTKALVERHPNHPVEVRTQLEQSSDENWDPTLTQQVWYCTSSRSHTTVSRYAEYQCQHLKNSSNSTPTPQVVSSSVAPTTLPDEVTPPSVEHQNSMVRKMIKFGTNCDLSDEKKWGPQLLELNKLPAWLRVVSPCNMLSHVGHQILGMNTVQLYMKVPCSRTPGHQENNNFCAVNINVGPGDSEWFGVSNEYWSQVESMCVDNGLSFLHGSWWPKLQDLLAAGIPTYRFLQRPGDVVWVNTGCVHWVQASGWCNNIAWNVGPLTIRQYQFAMERYEWNKSQRYQSIVAMIFLSWNLARNVKFADKRLHDAIRSTLLQSLTKSIQIRHWAEKKGLKISFHGRKRVEPAHYCHVCDEEVFQNLFVRQNEKTGQHIVHCVRCAIHLSSQNESQGLLENENQSSTKSISPLNNNISLHSFTLLEEYTIDELIQLYDNFVFNGKRCQI